MILAELYKQCKQCRACELRSAGATQVVPWEGGRTAAAMFISEAPGQQEDLLGIPFQGAAGKIFDKLAAALGFTRGKETHITNVVKCRPPKNRTPTWAECEHCGGLFLNKEIEIVKPRAIICFGKTAAQYVLGVPGGSLGGLRGSVHDLHGIPVVATYHPAYLLYNRKNEAAIKWSMWEDITAVLEAAQITYRRQQRKQGK